MQLDRWRHATRRKLRSLLLPGQADRELEEELAGHIAQQTEALIAEGVARAEAHRRARVAMKGVTRQAEECRDARGFAFLKSIAGDLRYAVRLLSRSPGFTAVTALVLALGIGCTTTMYTVVDRILLHPLDLPGAERMVNVSAVYPSGYDVLDLWGQNQSLEMLTHIKTGSINVGSGSQVMRTRVAEVTSRFFDVVGVPPALGAGFAGSDRAAVLSHGFWQAQYGGAPSVIGMPIRLSGHLYTITGVMPEGFDYPSGVSLWASHPEGVDAESRLGIGGLRMIARIRGGVTLDQANEQQRALWAAIDKQVKSADSRSAGLGLFRGLRPLADSGSSSYRVPLYLLLAAAVFVLLIGCANVANLILARAVGRRHEIAVRACLGAGRTRVARQLLSETVVLGLAGGTGGLCLAWTGLRLVRAIAPAGTPNLGELVLDWHIACFAAGISIVTGIIAGLAPALQVFSTDLNRGLTSKQRGHAAGRGGRRLRAVLVGVEVALALVLVTGASLAVQSLANFANLDFGFEPENLLTAQVGLPTAGYDSREAREAFQRNLLERASQIPGVSAVGATGDLPLEGGGGWYVGDFQKTVRVNDIDGDYFQAMGIPIVTGRGFTPSETGDAPVVIINQMLARTWSSNRSPIGRQLDVQSSRYPATPTVVGVAGNVRESYMGDPTLNLPEEELYVPTTAMAAPILVIRTAVEPASVTESLRKLLASIEPDAALYNVRTMEQVVSDVQTDRRFRARLFGAFAALALVLAVFGVYGVVSYATACRTQEIGVRISLGAQASDIRRLVLRQGLGAAVAGILIGALLSVWLTRLMANLLFGVRPDDPVTHAGAAALLLGAVVVASLAPARRAVRTNPVEALRQE